jgi:hypothetical protein
VGNNRGITRKRGDATFKIQDFFICLNLEKELSVDQTFRVFNVFVAL